MGINTYGQLGNGSTTTRSTPVQTATGVAAVAAGYAHTLFVKTDGTLWAMGLNSSGQLGDGSFTNRTTPVLIATGVASVAAGYAHTLFVKTDGTLWATGLNSSGQLGDGSTANRTTPVQIATGAAAVAVGGAHTLFVKTDGSLWATGYNISGQLGDGSTTSRSTPVQIATGVAAVSAGYWHTLFVKTDGTLWAMGINTYGQLGNGSTTTRSTPVQSATGVASVSAGDFHTLFAKTDGTLWAMGLNSSGQLGDGSTANRSTPVQSAIGVASVSAGATHTLFVKTDGSLWAMGLNSSGQLGDGTTTTRTTPVPIASGIVAAAAGGSHSLILFGPEGILAPPQLTVPTITWPTPSAITYGTTLSAAQLNATASVPGSFTYLPVAGTLLDAGTHTLTASFTPTDTSTYTTASATRQLEVNKTASTISWPTPANLIYGTSLSSTQLNATADVAGSFTYSPAAGAVLDAGNRTLSVMFTPTDSANYQGASTTRSLFVDKASASITLSNLTAAYTGSPRVASATTSPVGLGVTFTYDGSSTAPTTPGSYAVVATINDFNYAGSASGTLEIVAPPSVTLDSADQAVNEDGSLTLTASASGQPPFTFQWLKDGQPIGGATDSSLTLSQADASSAGSYTVRVTNPGGSTTSSPTTVSVNLKPAISGQGSTVNVPIGPDMQLSVDITAGTPPFTIQWKKDGVDIPNANSPTLTPTGPGEYEVYISNFAGQGSVKFILQGPPFVFSFADKVVAPGVTIEFTTQFLARSPVELQWLRNGVPIPGATDDVLTVENVQLGNLGLYSLRVRDPFGETTKSATLKFSQQITFNPLPDVAQSATPIALSATASSGLAVTFFAYDLDQAGNVVTPLNWGEGVVVAQQAGNEFYAAAASVERRFRVISRYETWMPENFTESELTDPAISGSEADPDSDGLSNFFEYALGLNPRQATTAPLPTVGMIDGFWTYLYQRPVDRLDVTYQVEVSRDLSIWLTSGFVPIKQSDDGVEETWRTQYITEDTLPVFFRLKVSRQ